MSKMNSFLFVMFTLLLLNVNGIHDNCKWRNILNTVLAVAPQIVALQETHLTVAQEYAFGACLPGYTVFYQHGSSNSAGVLTAIKRNYGIVVGKVQGHDGRCLKISFVYDRIKYNHINIYAPNDPDLQRTFFASLEAEIQEENNILCRDFNSVVSSMNRLLGRLDETSEDLIMLTRTNYLTEPEGFGQFPYQYLTIANRKSKIDFFFLSQNLVVKWKGVTRYCAFSDH